MQLGHATVKILNFQTQKIAKDILKVEQWGCAIE